MKKGRHVLKSSLYDNHDSLQKYSGEKKKKHALFAGLQVENRTSINKNINVHLFSLWTPVRAKKKCSVLPNTGSRHVLGSENNAQNSECIRTNTYKNKRLKNVMLKQENVQEAQA